MSGYTPEGFNGDDKEDWATDPDAPKAQMRTKEQFLGLTEAEILSLRGADLDAACALLCIDDVTWDEEDRVWVRSNGGIFRPSSSLNHAALAYESMAARGWGHCDIHLGSVVAACRMYALMRMQSIQSEAKSVYCSGKTEAEARTMACVLAAWKDGQDGII